MSAGAGTMIGSNVRLLEEIGEGSMGRVWLAEHVGLNMHVAVKLLHARRERDELGGLARFVREGRALARVKSPHVVQVFDQGVTDDGERFVVLELLEGESLQARLARKERLTMRQCAVVITGLARALAAAHRVGVIHRDIKPANIFLAATGDGPVVKVVDFGIARITDCEDEPTVTLDGAVLGTPSYMCPDQFKELIPANEHTDMWSLAVVAYECLTGTVPFHAPSQAMTFATIASGSFEPPSSRNPELPSEVDSWFERALSLDPEQRFASVTEMALTLLRLLPVPIRDLERQLVGMEPVFSMPPPSASSQLNVQPTDAAGGEEAEKPRPTRTGTLSGSTTEPRILRPARRRLSLALLLIGSIGLAAATAASLTAGDPAAPSVTVHAVPRLGAVRRTVSPEPETPTRARVASATASPRTTAAPELEASAPRPVPQATARSWQGLHPSSTPPPPSLPAKPAATSPPDPTSPDVLGF